MKRFAMILLAACVPLFGVSGKAMAAFTAGDLIQVVYQLNGANEVATDLGAFAPTTAYSGTGASFTTNLLPAAGTGAFTGSAWSDLQVAYFIKDAANTAAWVSGPQAGQTNGNRQGTGLQGNATSVISKYGSLGAASQYVLAQSDLQSYVTKMDLGSPTINAGFWGGFIPSKTGEQNLGALSTLGYVDSYLYYYGSANTQQAGLQVADIRLFADGHTEIMGASSAVPIPAPAMLLGSGLLALVGIRRKHSV